MKELGDILRLWERARASGEEAVLATVVKTSGSSYRNPGARLLITAGGLRAGAVSGGCLEDDLAKRAFWFTENGRTVCKYDTTADGDIATSGYGLGCNGTIYILLERIRRDDAAVFELIGDVLGKRRCAAVVHPAKAEHAGERLIIDTAGQASGSAAWLETEARQALEQGRSRSVIRRDTGEFFIEVLTPAPHLLIFGAGVDAIPLVRIAKLLGWQVSVFDGRADRVRRDRFPDADAVCRGTAADSDVGKQIDPWTIAVLMSHSYTQDLANLRELAAYPLRYLGILGPRKRTERLLADAGLDTDALSSTLHGPMGLDIGADGAEQFALAVAAEIQAALHGREGGLLRDRAGAIHTRDETEEHFPVQSIACA
jgi:xanthine/CO dehydrogenase XdhC/CoxF family maturation factor